MVTNSSRHHAANAAVNMSPRSSNPEALRFVLLQKRLSCRMLQLYAKGIEACNADSDAVHAVDANRDAGITDAPMETDPSPIEVAAQALRAPGTVRYWTDFLKVRRLRPSAPCEAREQLT